MIAMGTIVAFYVMKQPREDKIETPSGNKVTIRFFGHASIALKYNDHWIYVDPVGKYMNVHTLPHADVILLTHHHADHFDASTIRRLSKSYTLVIAGGLTSETLKGDNVRKFRPGNVYSIDISEDDDDDDDDMASATIRAVPAYNTTPAHMQYHPKDRGDCGYVVTLGGLNIYIAGDTEDTPEMLALKDIDVAFLPVNQPYTMTVAQAERAVKAIKPKIFYPYHYASEMGVTDLEPLRDKVKDMTDFRYRDMD